jgi:hypothetical protein
VSIVTVAGVIFIADSGQNAFTAFTTRPGTYLLHYWMLLLLGIAYTVWRVLRSTGRADAAGEPGVALAAFGLVARYYCDFLVLDLGYCYGSHSLVEQLPDGRLRFLIAFHQWAGLAAFVIGLLLVAIGSRPIRLNRSAREERPIARGTRSAPSD